MPLYYLKTSNSLVPKTLEAMSFRFGNTLPQTCSFFPSPFISIIISVFQANPVLQEFHQKCLNSHELIFAQVDWATAQADKSRIEADAVAAAGGETVPPGETDAEKLLSAILTANSALQEALNMYDDLKRVGIEQQAEEQSKKEWRMDRRVSHASAPLFIVFIHSPAYIDYRAVGAGQ
jgi:hypothetical protein